MTPHNPPTTRLPRSSVALVSPQSSVEGMMQ
jgi:hypothetical protein